MAAPSQVRVWGGWWPWGQLCPQEAFGGSQCQLQPQEALEGDWWPQGQLCPQEGLDRVGGPGDSSVPRRVWGVGGPRGSSSGGVLLCVTHPCEPPNTGVQAVPSAVTPGKAMAGCGVGGKAGGRGWGTGGLPSHFFPTDILQKTSIGATEPSGFTKALPRGDNVLPALSTQPVSPHPAMSLVTPRQPPKSFLHPRGHFFPPIARCQCHQNGLSAICAQPRKQDRGGDTRQGWGTGRGHPITSVSPCRVMRRSQSCQGAPSEAAASPGRCQVRWARW